MEITINNLEKFGNGITFNSFEHRMKYNTNPNSRFLPTKQCNVFVPKESVEKFEEVFKDYIISQPNKLWIGYKDLKICEYYISNRKNNKWVVGSVQPMKVEDKRYNRTVKVESKLVNPLKGRLATKKRAEVASVVGNWMSKVQRYYLKQWKIPIYGCIV